MVKIVSAISKGERQLLLQRSKLLSQLKVVTVKITQEMITDLQKSGEQKWSKQIEVIGKVVDKWDVQIWFDLAEMNENDKMTAKKFFDQLIESANLEQVPVSLECHARQIEWLMVVYEKLRQDTNNSCNFYYSNLPNLLCIRSLNIQIESPDQTYLLQKFSNLHYLALDCYYKEYGQIDEVFANICSEMPNLKELQIDCLKQAQKLDFSKGFKQLEKLSYSVFDVQFLKITDIQFVRPPRQDGVLKNLDISGPVINNQVFSLVQFLIHFNKISQFVENLTIRNVLLEIDEEINLSQIIKALDSSKKNIDLSLKQEYSQEQNQIKIEKDLKMLTFELIDFERFTIASVDSIEITGDDENKFRLCFEIQPDFKQVSKVQRKHQINIFAIDIFENATQSTE